MILRGFDPDDLAGVAGSSLSRAISCKLSAARFHSDQLLLLAVKITAIMFRMSHPPKYTAGTISQSAVSSQVTSGELAHRYLSRQGSAKGGQNREPPRQGSPCRGVHSFVGRKEKCLADWHHQNNPWQSDLSSNVCGKRQAGHARAVDCLVRASLACLHEGCSIFWSLWWMVYLLWFICACIQNRFC